MTQITYREYPNKLAAWGIGVFLENKLVGYIEKDGDKGYYYSPCNSHIVGETFSTIAEVKHSLEGE